MAEGYWGYGDGRAQPVQQAPPAQPVPPVKRPRPDYPVAGGPEYNAYMPREEDRAGQTVVRDTESISASYDRYLRNGQGPGGPGTYGPGEPVRPVSGGMPVHYGEDPRMMNMGPPPPMGYNLPPDASNTLFVEALPPNCTRREVSHIFRPFVGFREVRLVTKESRHPGGEPLVLCFADFSTPSQAAIALDALQGYKFDEHDRESANLRLQFARFPGPRSGAPRGRR